MREAAWARSKAEVWMRGLIVGCTIGLLALAGCADTSPRPVAYSGASSTCDSSAGTVGALAGAAGGGLLGNQFGKGKGKIGTTGAGVLAGGAGGYAAGNSLGGC